MTPLLQSLGPNLPVVFTFLGVLMLSVVTAVVAILAIGRAMALEGAIPSGTGLSKHIQAVTRAGGMPIAWNKIGRGLEALRAGAEIQYFGLSGVIEFDASGQSPAASTNWWTVGDSGFMDVTRTGTCR